MANRFKGLDLIDSMPEKFWMEVHNTVQEAMIKTIPKKKKEIRSRSKEQMQYCISAWFVTLHFMCAI